MMKRISWIIVIFVTANVLNAQNNKRPVDYADVFIGTSNSRWMLGPYASTPMGMVQLGPDNQGDV